MIGLEVRERLAVARGLDGRLFGREMLFVGDDGRERRGFGLEGRRGGRTGGGVGVDVGRRAFNRRAWTVVGDPGVLWCLLPGEKGGLVERVELGVPGALPRLLGGETGGLIAFALIKRTTFPSFGV